MLKALELIGFKSFADKTRFEFPPGITVVVGPNGSGKSNVVDAIKWVLGEQSAKSLRGKEMTDVIFKGTGESGRKALNAAEVTIIFDNSSRKLPFDAEVVHVTRRVYRSGEGEYLINGQPSRLKDIRDMFRGTGVGTDAYSLIEQGKVDQLLQASPRDRRAMFEEAAGISRFKAKKNEAQRRLERVEQNLLRLKDIVDEVENRVRAVRSQASKARKYREYSERLQHLRTHVGATDWRQLSGQLDELDRDITRLRSEASTLAAEAEANEARALVVDTQLESADESIRLCEGRLARQHEGIIGHEATVEQNRARCRELEEFSHRYRNQLAAMTGRVGDLRERLRETTTALTSAEAIQREIGDRVAGQERRLSEVTRQLDEQRTVLETLRTVYVDSMRRAAGLGNRISGLESRLDGIRTDQQRMRHCWDDLLATIAAAGLELEKQQTCERELAEQVAMKERLLASGEQEAAALRSKLSETREQLVQLQHRLSAARERAAVLEELEQNREGLSDGVREVLELAQLGSEDWHAEIAGLVADILHVGVDIAPLVDIALGESAQHIVLTGERFLEELQRGRYRPAGRVGFIQSGEHVSPEPKREWERRAGVLGRADRLVRCDVRFRSLVDRLLDDTWLVTTLPLALALRATTAPPCRFVTATGELVERNGTIVVGPRNPVAGLVSRRNELRELQAEIVKRQAIIDRTQEQVGRLLEFVEHKEALVKQLLDEHAQAATGLAGRRVQVQTVQDRVSELQRHQGALAGELETARSQEQEVQAELDAVHGESIALEAHLAQTQSAIRDGELLVERLEAERNQHSIDATAAKVELAKAEQQLDTLRARMTQFQDDQRERSRAIVDASHQLAESLGRLRRAEREILQSTSTLADLYLAKEMLAGQRTQQQAEREALAAERAHWTNQIQSQRKRAQQIEERLHKKELAAQNLRHQRVTLEERLRDDYGVDIAKIIAQANPAEQAARDEIEAEIADLRRKLSYLGSVNMEALAELDELEARFNSLHAQFQDLVQAKESLERIIQKINADSRRLFQETLEAIRVNFQTLYRKAFGGGRADIVLEEGIDPLEAGVELLATPPGKPQFNNSLLSGGEKALTAVALLLAVFQFHPSPFCVLDEVDAPFDEANIGRFVEVLRGFLGWTKFVIVTHSKKTMTAATTLYGVTMQESGVSKRVSVRFEDVSEDGHISPEAVERDRGTEPGRQAA